MRNRQAVSGAVLCVLLALTLASCTTVPVHRAATITKEYDVQLAGAPFMRHDLCHVVAPGETLYRLSKIYGVAIPAIMRANNIKSPQELAVGLKLTIPAALPVKAIVPLYESDKWKYIIIHHSATDQGNALSLFLLHLRRGFLRGLGYDFVISNGTSGRKDGQIEVSPRWIHQEEGAHCKASAMNHCGIGICLVGNFSKERVSEAQLASLVSLVNTLRAYYHIPVSHIMGHGQVPGAATECPGTKFPWAEFRRRLKEAT